MAESTPHDPSVCCDLSPSPPASDTDHCCGHGQEADTFNLRTELIPIAIAGGLFLLGLLFEGNLIESSWKLGRYLIFIPAYFISGWGVLTTAGRNVLRGKLFDENFLMTIATLGAIAIGELPEAVGVMLFFQIGELFQNYSVGRSRRSIKALLAVRPDTATVQINGRLQTVSPEQVKVGQVVVVRPGEKVPLDGEILRGESWVNTSALTGESIPRHVVVGETVMAGVINQSGALILRVKKLFGDSSVARILELVENAHSKKADTEKFITRFARIYTPIVVALSLTIALLPPLLLTTATQSEWVYRALVLLVISCPCGLVISIPLGYFGGVGGAAKQGILIKGSTFIDTLTQVRTVVFDKTGTLTQGNFQVTGVVSKNGLDQQQLLALAAQVESQSNHPVAQSIRQAYGQTIDESGIETYEEIAGYGIRATVNGQRVIAGNDRLLHQEAIPHDVCTVGGGTVAHLAIGGQYSGHIIIRDELKEDAAAAIQDLQDQGIQTVMLTGDSQDVADEIALQLGLDSYQAELLPKAKVEALESLLSQAQKTKQKVVFVGDGINDAPVIARADVGIAMGGLGSDAAIETADVVIMTDAPSKVSQAIQIARRTRRIIWQNITLAIAIKVLFISLGAVGGATLWEAVFADVGVALLAILNASRILRA